MLDLSTLPPSATDITVGGQAYAPPQTILMPDGASLEIDALGNCELMPVAGALPNTRGFQTLPLKWRDPAAGVTTIASMNVISRFAPGAVVTPPNMAPVAGDDGPYVIQEGNTADQVLNVGANDSDSDGFIASMTIVSHNLPAGVVVSVLDPSNIVLTGGIPAGTATGTYTITYQITDDDGATANAMADVQIVAMPTGSVITTEAQLEGIINAAMTSSFEASFQCGDWGPGGAPTPQVVTSPDAARALIEAHRATPQNNLWIHLDWDGPMSGSGDANDRVTWRGPTAAQLASAGFNSNAAIFGGYDRAPGVVRISNAPGRSPILTNRTYEVFGIPHFCIDGVGFQGRAMLGDANDGDNIRQVVTSFTSTFPTPCALAVDNCEFGLANVGGDVTEYIKGVAANGISCAVTNCRFEGVRNSVSAITKYARIEGNVMRRYIADLITQFGYSNGHWVGEQCYAIVRDNTAWDAVDDTLFNGEHTDFYQIGTSADQHVGNYSLLERNLTIEKTVQAFDSGAQAYYSDDHLTARNSAIIRNNFFCISAYNVAAMLDVSGEGGFFVHNNTYMRTGDWYNRTNPPVLNTFGRAFVGGGVGNQATLNGGVINVDDNILSAVVVTLAGATVGQSGNVVMDPSILTAADPASPESVFDLTGVTVNRNPAGSPAGWLTWSAPWETSTSEAAVKAGVSAAFRPSAGGYGAAGMSDPTTW